MGCVKSSVNHAGAGDFALGPVPGEELIMNCVGRAVSRLSRRPPAGKAVVFPIEGKQSGKHVCMF